MYDLYGKLTEVVKEKTILIVDDNDDIIDELEKLFILFFSNVQRASDGEEGFQKLKEKRYDIVLTDLEMPILSGTDMIRKVKSEINENQKFIALSGFIDTYEEELNTLNIKQRLEKPYYVDKLFEAIITIIEEK